VTKSCLLMCQTVKAFLPEMMSRDSGHIVTVSSIAAMFGVNGLGDYCASKAASAGFHESVRAELYAANKTGVHMTLICPYCVNTGMFDGCKFRLLTCLWCWPAMPKNHCYECPLFWELVLALGIGLRTGLGLRIELGLGTRFGLG